MTKKKKKKKKKPSWDEGNLVSSPQTKLFFSLLYITVIDTSNRHYEKWESCHKIFNEGLEKTLLLLCLWGQLMKTILQKHVSFLFSFGRVEGFHSCLW